MRLPTTLVLLPLLLLQCLQCWTADAAGECALVECVGGLEPSQCGTAMSRASKEQMTLLMQNDGIITAGVEFKGTPLSYFTLNGVKLDQFGPDFSLGALIKVTAESWKAGDPIQLWSYGKRGGGTDSCGFSCDFRMFGFGGDNRFGCKAGAGDTWAGVNMMSHSDITQEKWFHLAVHKNAGTLTFYVNGVNKGTAKMPSAGWGCGSASSYSPTGMTFGKFEGDEGSPAKFTVTQIRLSGSRGMGDVKAVASLALETGPECLGAGMDYGQYWQIFVILALVCWLPDLYKRYKQGRLPCAFLNNRSTRQNVLRRERTQQQASTNIEGVLEGGVPVAGGGVQLAPQGGAVAHPIAGAVVVPAAAVLSIQPIMPGPAMGAHGAAEGKVAVATATAMPVVMPVVMPMSTPTTSVALSSRAIGSETEIGKEDGDDSAEALTHIRAEFDRAQTADAVKMACGQAASLAGQPGADKGAIKAMVIELGKTSKDRIGEEAWVEDQVAVAFGKALRACM